MQDTTWVDRRTYPFRPRAFEVEGHRLHYVDEGEGAPIVFVHGTPTWSFLYRHLIRDLRHGHRCIAADHLGFGLSDKPARAPYRPADHARRLRALIEHLDLRHITMVGHDFGGPIGLSYAVDRPETVRAVVLFNTWMWSLRRQPRIHLAALTGGGPLGRLVVRRLNLELRILFPAVWGDRSNLDAGLHRQYLGPFPRPQDREAQWVLAGELLGSSEWFDGLWSRRDRIRHLPALHLWGLKDRFLPPPQLARWAELFPTARTEGFPGVGHFVPEEAKDEVGEIVRRFLRDLPAAAGESGGR